MSLNDTLDRLIAEREQKQREAQQNNDSARLIIANTADRISLRRMPKDINPGMSEQREARQDNDSARLIIANLAERIFFQRMLKDINPGMIEPRIDAMIDRSVMIATKLYNRLYR